MGTNLFAFDQANFSINYNGNIYQYIDSLYCYQFNGENTVAFYNWKLDKKLQKNLYQGQLSREMLQCDSSLKRSIQFFNESIIKGNMNIEKIQIKNKQISLAITW
jgi:hypothetical protein